MIYIPNKLRVGFCNRSDTYTGKLAYVIYYDQNGKLRKETSWDSWRDHDIAPEEYENVPTSGFVINKNAGGRENSYSYDVRKTYVRVYDPRGFEFEISIPNLLFILENTNSIKGKGLEGDFVYGWNGTELVLIPVESPEYAQWISKSSQMQNSSLYLDPTVLKVGYKYKIKHEGNEKEIIYMGKFNEYIWEYDADLSRKKPGKRYFVFVKGWSGYYLDTLTSMKERILECMSDSVVENYAELLEKMESDVSYSPIVRHDYQPISFGEFEVKVENRIWHTTVFVWDKNGVLYELTRYRPYGLFGSDGQTGYQLIRNEFLNGSQYKRQVAFGSLNEIYEFLHPHKRLSYQANGNLYSEVYCK